MAAEILALISQTCKPSVTLGDALEPFTALVSWHGLWPVNTGYNSACFHSQALYSFSFLQLSICLVLSQACP